MELFTQFAYEWVDEANGALGSTIMVSAVDGDWNSLLCYSTISHATTDEGLFPCCCSTRQSVHFIKHNDEELVSWSFVPSDWLTWGRKFSLSFSISLAINFSLSLPQLSSSTNRGELIPGTGRGVRTMRIILNDLEPSCSTFLHSINFYCLSYSLPRLLGSEKVLLSSFFRFFFHFKKSLSSLVDFLPFTRLPNRYCALNELVTWWATDSSCKST